MLISVHMVKIATPQFSNGQIFINYSLKVTRLPHILVGDEAFQLTQHLLRPFEGNHLDVKKRIYNYQHCRARRYVECAFGIMANKWRILHRPLNVNKIILCVKKMATEVTIFWYLLGTMG